MRLRTKIPCYFLKFVISRPPSLGIKLNMAAKKTAFWQHPKIMTLCLSVSICICLSVMIVVCLWQLSVMTHIKKDSQTAVIIAGCCQKVVFVPAICILLLWNDERSSIRNNMGFWARSSFAYLLIMFYQN